MKILSQKYRHLVMMASFTALSVACLPLIQAQVPSPTSMADAPKSGSASMADSDFMMKAALGGMTEVQLGKLAQEKGASDEVKQFGAHMAMDHGNAGEKLKGVATKKGVTLPTALDDKHQAMVERLTKLSGADFDNAYVKAMVKAHKKDLAEFTKASADSQDPEVKGFATDTIPMIKQHLSDIEAIQAKMK